MVPGRPSSSGHGPRQPQERRSALTPETATRWCGAGAACARRGSRTSVSDACGRPGDSDGRRAASTARSVDLRTRGAAAEAALASPIHDRPRYGSATRLWVITSFQERDYLAPMASRVRRGAQGRLLDRNRVDGRMTTYRWRPGGGRSLVQQRRDVATVAPTTTTSPSTVCLNECSKCPGRHVSAEDQFLGCRREQIVLCTR